MYSYVKVFEIIDLNRTIYCCRW